MVTLTIDGKEITVEDGMNVLQACEEAGAEIPYFCYHERLSIAGNCRMCLVEMEKSPKPIASCAMPVGEGMVIWTNTEQVRKAREGVMEFLLINHPLDCPICDQGGECDLQDQAIAYGKGTSRYLENKRAVREKYMGPLIKTIMTRCIHCTRCIRFATEIAGVEELGALGRGEHMEVTTYLEKAMTSELSGNVIDLCPVGALTSRPYAFTARSWELKKTNSIDVMDALGSNIRVDARGNQVMRVLPRLCEDINQEWISDKTRFACDGLGKRRLDRPWILAKGKHVEASWDDALHAVAKAMKKAGGSEIAAVTGDMADMESMYALRELFDSMGSKRLESRQDGAKLNTKHRGAYLFNSRLAGVDEADACLLIGANPRHAAPVLNARLGQRVRLKKLAVANIGMEVDLGYGCLQLGDDARELQKILDGKSPFARILKQARRPMLIIGQAALQRSDGAALLYLARKIAEKYALIQKDWNGFNVLHDAAARVGGLSLGLVSRGGISAILRDAKKGALKVLFLLGTDEIETRALDKTFVVYLGSHGDRGAHAADVILPAAAYTEKPGIYINTEGRVQYGERAVFPPGDAREDWTIIRALSDMLHKSLPFDDLQSLRSQMFEKCLWLNAEDGLLPPDWGAFGKKGTLKAGKFPTDGLNFYLTNPIARASPTMAACVEALADTVESKGTGTHG